MTGHISSSAGPVPRGTADGSLTDLLAGVPVVPVVVLDSGREVPALAAALRDGGLPCAEVTLRTPGALDALRAFAREPGMVVGAGSVRTVDQVDEVVDAGARFVVSPGLSAQVLARCRARGVPALPGVATATEIMRALDAGVDVVKVFPVGRLGGPGGVRDLAAPFPGLRFVPTGGVRAADLAEYLAVNAVAAVGGSWMVAAPLVRAGRYDEVRRLTQECVTIAREVRP
ncbi:bifunctional 4-hydroxy-2-oxoglutarate aldolase/2-dehydro-3-deoxy-phosphogluconate aldolase [Kineosporia sp. A_224]|uniref:bifunctional 4-hydroxy-2-oxoglutarate aldolase/2-dehydro-3-deoxy-phosphogluconate aldolase n=1 Tax=Kineosporia sp. A_224 TaxID=1962180 RepID=UPI00350EF2A5